MPIEARPPAIVAPCPADRNPFSGQKTPDFHPQPTRVKADRPFAKRGVSPKLERHKGNNIQLGRRQRNVVSGIGRESKQIWSANEERSSIQPDFAAQTESFIEVLDQVAVNFRGDSFAERTTTEKIGTFGEKAEKLIGGGELNPQRLKELSKLDLSSKELAPFKPLLDSVSKHQQEKLKTDLREMARTGDIQSFLNDLKEHPERIAFGAVALGALSLMALAVIKKEPKYSIAGASLLLLLQSCCSKATPTEIAATKTATKTATATVVSTEVAQIIATPLPPTESTTITFRPPENPPVFTTEGSGGPLTEKFTPEYLDAQKYRATYVAAVHDGVKLRTTGTLDELRADLDNYARNYNVDILQVGDGTQLVTIAIREYSDGHERAIWLADADNGLLGARPDVPPAENYIEGELEIPYGFDLKGVYNDADNNFYFYLADELNGNPIAWFDAVKASVDLDDDDNPVVNGWYYVDADGVPQFDQLVVFGDEGPQVVDRTGKVLMNFDFDAGQFVDLTPSLPPEFLAQFDPSSYHVAQGVVVNNSDGLPLMTYNAVTKEWQLPDLFPGLPPTVDEFPKIADSDPLIALLVQKDRALAEADGFFSDAATEAKVGIAAGGLGLMCDKGAVPCIKDMESFSRDVQTDKGIVTQYFVIRAIKVPVTEKTPTGVVVWACFLAEKPSYPHSDSIYDDPDFMLEIAKMNDGRLKMFIMTDRSVDTSGLSFETWFDNPDFVAQMKAMREKQAIWNLDWPVTTEITNPDIR